MASHLDPQLEDRILHEVKSQGVFDEFRKDSMADVDTKPAYQNLRQRVENTVKKFLSEQQWTPEMNKNQLREKLRRHITESGFLDVGVERIVDQVVNPKIGTVFQPRIEEITYKYLGLPPPPPKHEPPPPPMMHPLPPLPLSGTPLKIETSSLLPTGLEQVSPDSDKATVKSECREDDRSVLDMDVDTDEKVGDDDDESPPFEPLVKCVTDSVPMKIEKLEKTEEKVDEKSVMIKQEIIEIENLTKLKAANQQDIRDFETQDTSVSANSTERVVEKNANLSFVANALMSQDSQLSQVSSDSNISDVTANASHSFTHNTNSSTPNAPPTMSEQMEAAIELASANISEEAQMPKFPENSSEMIGAKTTPSELHFDIKKDEIKFEGTERKSNLLEQEGECNTVTEDDVSSNQANTLGGDMQKKEEPHHFNNNLEIKEQPHHFGNLAIESKVNGLDVMGPSTLAPTPSPTPHDSSFGSSLEDSCVQQFKGDEKTEEAELKAESATESFAAFSMPLQQQGDKKEICTTKNQSSSTSSSRHKKHSKDKKRSHDSKDKDRDRSKHRDKSRNKDRSSDKDRDKSKHRDKERHRDKDSSRKDKDKSRDKDKEKDRSRKDHKSSKTKSDNSTERSSSSKHSSSSTGRSHDTSSSKIQKHTTSKHRSSFTTSSSSSSRSESQDAKREKRNSDKKHHRSSSKNENSRKKDDEKVAKIEASTDDHGVEKAKVRRQKSTDSNDEDRDAGNTSRLNGGSEREKGSLSSTGSSNDKQPSEQKNSTETPKEKTKNDLEECVDQEKHAEDLNIKINDGVSDELSTRNQHRNKVVILNDMLENPNINYIDLGPTATTYNLATQATSFKDDKVETTITQTETSLPARNTQTFEESESVDSNDLLYFEEVSAQFSNRLRLLDNAMDRCRRVVNNLRFDCANEFCNSYVTGEEQQNANETNMEPQTCATLTIDCVPTFAAEDGVNRANSPTGVYDGSRKRNNNGNLIQSKPSPTPSDASVNSKENMALDKNADEVKCIRHTASVNKMSQQRYASEDLYKPRPVLSQRSRRRGMDTVI